MKDQILKIKDKLMEGIRNHKEIAAACLILAGVVCFFLFNDFQSKEEYYDVTLKTVEEAASGTKGETTVYQNKKVSDINSESAETDRAPLNTEVSVDVPENTEVPAEEPGTEQEASATSEKTEETSPEKNSIADGETKQTSETDTRFRTDSSEVTQPPVLETTEAVTTTKESGQEETEPDVITVYISIDCMNILEHMDDLKDGDILADYIGNGKILDKTGYQISAGSTVFDLLKMTARANQIQLDYQGESASTYNTVYVKGIQYIYEKACGSSSGWMYMVNGEWAGVGCSSKKLEDGDFVQWRFSCDGGNDLRGS